VLKTKADLLGWEGMRIRQLVRTRMEEQGWVERVEAATKELEALRPQLDAARERERLLRDAELESREEALRDTWQLEDRYHELEGQLADGAAKARA